MSLALARAPLARLLRSPRAWVSVAGWTLLAVVTAIVVRVGKHTNGADHVMRGAFAVIVLPLVAYVIVGAVLGGAGLRRSIRGLVALGAAPRGAAFATTAVAMFASAIACAVIGCGVAVLAHGASDPPILRDALASLWIGALGGAAYAAYFSAGSAIGRGAMRGVFLALDWIVGGSGFGGLFTPRGHVRSLLGGLRCFELPPRASSIVLAVLAILWCAVAVALARRPAK